MNPGTVLIVDDHPANLVAMTATLEPLGRRIVTAGSGHEALRRVLEQDFACILMDVQMPELDGIETARLIAARARDLGRQIPILLVTALDREDAQLLRGYGAGAVDYLIKPFDAEVLRAKVRAFVELHEREQRVRDREAQLHQAEMQRAQIETRAERQKLHDIFMQAPVAICILEGPRHTFTFANPAYLALAANAELVGKPILEALPGLEGQGFDVLLDRVVATGEPFIGREVEVKLPHHAGDEVDYMNFVYQPKRNARGEVDGVMVCAFEVSDHVVARRRAEAAAEALRQADAQAERMAVQLRDSELQFRTLADSIPQLAWIAEANGDIHWYNRRWYEYTGTTLAQMDGWGWQRVHDPVELARMLPRFKAAIASGEAWEDTFPLRRADGVYRWFLSRAMPVRDSSGVIVRWFGTNTDVEEQRHAERMLRSLVDNLPELAWTADPDGHIDFYNRRWYEYTGTTFEQMEGWGWETVHDPQVLPQVVTRWKHSLTTGEPFEMEFPLRGVDGAFRWFLTRVRPLRDSHGQIVRWIGTNTDVDDQRRQAESLHEAIELRDDFLAIAGHELKTPLSTLSMHIQSIQRARKADVAVARLDERLDKAARSVLRLENLINQMLDVSRITAGQLRLETERLDLDDLLREVVERFSEQAAVAGTPISLRIDGHALGAWDRLRIEQVFSNLIGNALKYGRGRPIDVQLVSDADQVMFRVVDQGIGIEAAQQQRIFERFERAVGARDFGGFGLGLWISRQIVEASGGRVEVFSAPGQGATFTVWLPFRQQEETRDPVG